MMFEDKKGVWSERLKNTTEELVGAVRRTEGDFPGIEKAFTDLIDLALEEGYDKGYEKAAEEAPDCDNCDKRRREPRINEGYL